VSTFSNFPLLDGTGWANRNRQTDLPVEEHYEIEVHFRFLHIPEDIWPYKQGWRKNP
jgi:hypothetical protein